MAGTKPEKRFANVCRTRRGFGHHETLADMKSVDNFGRCRILSSPLSHHHQSSTPTNRYTPRRLATPSLKRSTANAIMTLTHAVHFIIHAAPIRQRTHANRSDGADISSVSSAKNAISSGGVGATTESSPPLKEEGALPRRSRKRENDAATCEYGALLQLAIEYQNKDPPEGCSCPNETGFLSFSLPPSFAIKDPDIPILHCNKMDEGLVVAATRRFYVHSFLLSKALAI